MCYMYFFLFKMVDSISLNECVEEIEFLLDEGEKEE